ncbi:hypothetical protein NE237_003262 [Protea cynaroides]|uniref:DUF7953 domain-containing protein n=1 Tax=Protea cynaroides TaxID=273540 RepID=A0A9Q0KGH6_9MAGN|nr:hypothetical protein NE237_003262 [Protea cynaroides]
MMIKFRTNLKALALLPLLGWLFICFFPGVFSSGVVTLDSIQIFKNHEILNAKPTVYFRCKGENRTILPDVKKTHVVYTFKGEESWQPLTELPDKKCKRCGFYEMDSLKSDDVFDEWELCSSDFIVPDGNYVHSKDKEFNATFFCPKCVHLENSTDHASGSHHGADTGMRMHVFLVVLISAVVSTVSIVGAVAAYRYWQWRKREQDQARFLKLFEEGDDIEDELDLGQVL